MAENPYEQYRNMLPSGAKVGEMPERQEPQTTARGVAQNVAAGSVEGGTSLLNIATDPFGTVIGPAIARVGGTLYDAGAHLTGLYQPMTEEQRRDLYGQNPAPPEQQPLATRVVNAVDQAIPGGTKVADVPANTPAEQIARKVTAAGVAGGTGGVGPALVATGGAVTGDVAGRVAPDWLAPGAELTGNVVGGYATSRALTPVRTVTTPERQRLVGVAQQEGIPLTAGQQTGSKPLIKTEQMLGQTIGSAGGEAKRVDTQQRAINRAVASRAGLNSDTLTTDVLNAHLDNVGSEIGNLAQANNMQLPAGFIQQLGQVRQALKYEKSEVAQEIGARIDQFRDMITVDPATGQPILAGPHYQNLQSDLRKAISSSEGSAQSKLIEFRDQLRQQMEASMNPADAARWRELNRQYANGTVIQDAMGAAGAGAAEGNISLLQLREAIKRSMGRDAYAKGYGDLNELARVGQSVLRNPSDSGSPQGISINKLLSGAQLFGAGAGAGAGIVTGDPFTGTLATVAPIAVPWTVGAAMRSRPGTAYLTNQLTRDVNPAVTAAIIQAADAETERNRLAPQKK